MISTGTGENSQRYRSAKLLLSIRGEDGILVETQPFTMLRLLVDTCVWLDLAKDPRQQSVLGVLEILIEMKKVELIIPRTVLDEFHRNKMRIMEESKRSFSSHIKMVKDVVEKFGEPSERKIVLNHLNDVNHKAPLLGEHTAQGSLSMINTLLKSSPPIEVNDDLKLRAVQRAIDRRAPFHRMKNSIDDAIIIEVYADQIKDRTALKPRFAFVTHNFKDFSDPNSSNKLPHPDFEAYFSKRKSRYFISLREALRTVKQRYVTDVLLDQEEFELEPRTYTEIMKAQNELSDKVWYNRHQNLVYDIETGKVKIIDRRDLNIDCSQDTIVRDIWEGAKVSAKKMVDQYGLEELGPWDDFEWGMLNGKLSALRWVLGEEWDMLDT